MCFTVPFSTSGVQQPWALAESKAAGSRAFNSPLPGYAAALLASMLLLSLRAKAVSRLQQQYRQGQMKARCGGGACLALHRFFCHKYIPLLAHDPSGTGSWLWTGSVICNVTEVWWAQWGGLKLNLDCWLVTNIHVLGHDTRKAQHAVLSQTCACTGPHWAIYVKIRFPFSSCGLSVESQLSFPGGIVLLLEQ